METSHEIKPPRRGWSARDLVLFLAIVTLAIAFLAERRAREADARQAAVQVSEARAWAADQLDRMTREQIERKSAIHDRLDKLESRLSDLEHERSAKGGR